MRILTRMRIEVKRPGQSLLFGIVCGLLLFGCVGQPKDDARTTTIHLSLILGETSDWYAGAERFAQLLERETQGRYRVKLDPKATLSNSNQESELENVQNGVIEASLESTILLSTLDQRFSVWSLPWLFRDHAQAAEVMDGTPGREMLNLLPPKQLVGLAYGTNGFRQITNNRRPIRIPADLEGLKIRIPAIKMYTDVFRAFGADPSAMNFGDLITALKQGTMDGQENPLSVIYPARLFEVQKHLTLWDYSYDPIILCFSQKFFESLSEGDQSIFRRCAQEAMADERSLVARHDVEYRRKLEEAGMTIVELDPLTRAAFARKAAPVYGQYREIIGAELLEQFLRAVGK